MTHSTLTEREAGLVLGRYRIVRRLAQGGMGVVYLGRLEGAAGFAKPVVIKRVLPSLERAEETTARFIREAQILSHLQHPGIVSVLDFGEEVGGYCMVLEYVHGFDLAKWLKYLQVKKATMAWEDAVYILLQVLEALSYSHNFRRSDGTIAEVLHRDVSPANVLLDMTGRVRLTDFGIARMAEEEDSQYKTRTGVVSGKMSYLAPELMASGQPSPSSDLYACGIVLYQMLTGRNPFAAESPSRTMWRAMTDPPDPLANHRDGLPPALQGIVSRALAKTREERYASAAELAQDLRAVLERQEADIALALAERFRADFGGEMATLLDLLPLAERELAWRTGGNSEQGVGERPAPEAIGHSLGAAPPNAEAARREQATARPPQARRERSLQGAAVDAPQSAGDCSVPAPAGSRLDSRMVILAAAMVAVAAAVVIAVSWFDGGSKPAASQQFIVVGERKPGLPAEGRTLTELPSQESSSPVTPTGAGSPVAADRAEEPAVTKSARARTKPRGNRKRVETPASLLARQLRKSQGALQDCFRANTTEVEGHPALQLSYTVAPNGTVERVAVEPAIVQSTALGRCVIEVARGTRFEGTGEAITFSVPIRAHTRPKR